MEKINLYEFDKRPYSFPSENLKISSFKDYLNSIWDNRNRYNQEEKKEEDDRKSNKNQQFFKFDGHKCIPQNYVGMVQYEGIRLNIYPKIFKEQPIGTSNILPQVFYWLSHSKRIRFPFTQMPLSHQQIDDWLEAFIYVFANYTEEILSSQPYQTYQEITEETSFLRGRLAMPEYIRQNLITGRYQYFQSTYEPFIYDNQFNRIVKYVSNLLLNVSVNPLNQDKLHEILFLLGDVSDIQCTSSHCDFVKLNPLFQDLQVILEMCRLFLESSSISQNDETNTNFCLLFPMEVIFEDFIFGFIEKHFPNRKPFAQSGKYLAKNENKENVFKLNQDIKLKHPDLIIDTKYKIRGKPEIVDKKKGINQADMYQMLAYSIREGVKNVLLIYPTESHKISGTKDIFTIENHDGKVIITEIHAIDVNITGDNNIEIEDNLKKELSKVFYDL